MNHIIITFQESMSVLSGARGLDLLVTLAKNPDGLKYSDCLDILRGCSPNTLDSRIKKFLEAGLIVNTKSKDFPFTRNIRLSKKGTLLASHLLEIETILVEKTPNAGIKRE